MSHRIARIETIPVSIPIHPARAIRSGRGAHTTSPFLIVKIHTDEGLVGLGEVSCTPVWSGEDQVSAAHFIRDLLEPALRGEPATEVERLGAVMRKLLANNPFTRAGIEMALWDLLGKAAGLPLHRLWGGPVRERVRTKFSVSGLAPERAAEIAAWAVEQGFSAMKVKVGLGPDADVARVRAVRAAVGDDVLLGVDANGGWTLAEAHTTIERLRPFGLAFVEQPVPPSDPAWLADVRARSHLPVVADESVATPEDAISLIRGRAADVLSVYVGKGGGLGAARRITMIAEAGGASCTIGSNLEMGIASAAMLHLAVASPGIVPEHVPCDILSPFYYEGDLLAEPLDIRAGEATAPQGPGLGVTLDDDAVEHYRVR
jgi:L-alanine-DL-glutamate epimerase-like enolase superfamily enzyme